MTRNVPNFHLDAILGFALLIWTVAVNAASEAVPAEVNAPSLVLTNAEQVHCLSREEAAGGRPVLIRGVITCSLPEFKAAVVQDATDGVYFDLWNSPLGEPPPVGELVEVEGVTDPGKFAPQISALRVRRLGPGELPPPVHPYWDRLINGGLDTVFVELEGVLTTVRADAVTLLTHAGKISALIFDKNGGTNNLALKPYDGALVRLRGCLFASWDAATHQVNVSQVRMFEPSVSVVEPAPADAFVGLKNTVAAWAAPARNMAIQVNARALTSFKPLLIGNGLVRVRGVDGGVGVHVLRSQGESWVSDLAWKGNLERALGSNSDRPRVKKRGPNRISDVSIELLSLAYTGGYGL